MYSQRSIATKLFGRMTLNRNVASVHCAVNSNMNKSDSCVENTMALSVRIVSFIPIFRFKDINSFTKILRN